MIRRRLIIAAAAATALAACASGISNAPAPAPQPATTGSHAAGKTEVLWIGQAATRITTPGGKVIVGYSSAAAKAKDDSKEAQEFAQALARRRGLITVGGSIRSY